MHTQFQLRLSSADIIETMNSADYAENADKPQRQLTLISFRITQSKTPLSLWSENEMHFN